MRISDWSSDVCSSDLPAFVGRELEQGFVDRGEGDVGVFRRLAVRGLDLDARLDGFADRICLLVGFYLDAEPMAFPADLDARDPHAVRSEEHTSELQSLMRISYAVFCLKKKKSKDMTLTQYIQKKEHI